MFVDFIDGGTFIVPEAFSLYLSAFGKTFLASGTTLRFRLAPRSYLSADNIVEFFGRLGPDTHYLYGAYPCLAVSTARILADVAFHPGDPRAWDLPDAIRPLPEVGMGPHLVEEAGHVQQKRPANHPTRNVIGYDYAVRLNSYQQSWLTNIGIANGAFHSSNASVSLHPQLMQAVSTCFAECKCFKFTNVTLGNFEGSQTQINCVWDNPFETVIPTEDYLQCNLETRSADKQDVSLAPAGLLSCFRIRREPRPTRTGLHINNWCVYSFNEYADVPETWVNTANALGAF